MACEDLRDVLRTNLALSRQTNRDQILNFKRKALHDSIDIDRVINSSEVSLVANKLKSKSAVQIEDLALLKLALVQSSDNTITFLKVKGALHGLIRELSSGRSNYQLTAAECCCNLALGDVKSCLQIAKAAGPYLISMLSGGNYNMINVSVWTLGNLVGSGEKVWRVVHSQGFLPKLLTLLQEYDSTEHDLQVQKDVLHNSLGAMVQLLRVGGNLLMTDEVESIATVVSNAKKSSEKGLKTCEYLLSCIDSAEKTLVENQVHLKCLEFLSETILNEDTVASFTAAERTVANLVAESTGNCALQVFQVWKMVENFTGKIMSSPYSHLKMEIHWLLGNLFNHPSTQVQAALLHDSSSEFRMFLTTVCS